MTILTRLERNVAKEWQLHEAKARLSEVIDESIGRGPQTVTRHGRPVAVVVGADDFRRLSRSGRDFKAFLRVAPLRGLNLARSRDRGRRVGL
jgi:prevent-host-death family protein